MTGSDVVERLRAVLPPAAVVTEAAALAERASDRSGLAGDTGALALVRPGSTAEVSAALAVADATGTPVVPQGALTGLAGGGNALPGALLLDLGRMRRILSIDPVERHAVVQPGVIVADLQAAVADQGLFYPPDPASAAISTIGGTIATNAGGMRAIKYGVTRDSVRSLEVVLADGTVLRTRAQTVKAVAGLDLTDLIVGSEGTLAVVTEATLALRPAPGTQAGVAATFPDVASALEAANAIVTGGALPVTLELLDGVALDAIRALEPDVDLPGVAASGGPGAWLVAVTDDEASATADLARFEAAMHEHGALGVQRAGDERELHAVLAARRQLHPAMRALRGASLNGDVALPRRRLAEFVRGLDAVAARHGIGISVGGHVGDGNLHPVLAFDGDDAEAARTAHAAFADVVALAQSLGGTATGEHGVGLEKLPALAGEFDERMLALQRRVKAAFDPRGILNPGKKLG